MTQYKYDKPEDMGDLTEFAAELGTWPNGHYPAHSGRISGSADAWVAIDEKLNGPGPHSRVFPAPDTDTPLREAWPKLLARTVSEARKRFRKIDSVEKVTALLVDKYNRTRDRLHKKAYDRLFSYLLVKPDELEPLTMLDVFNKYDTDRKNDSTLFN